jgi:hypothetical protein
MFFFLVIQTKIISFNTDASLNKKCRTKANVAMKLDLLRNDNREEGVTLRDKNNELRLQEL